MSLTLSNSANSSSRVGLTGSFKNLANSSMVMRPPLQELAMVAKPSSSFLMLSHFRLRESTSRKFCCVSVTLNWFNMESSQIQDLNTPSHSLLRLQEKWQLPIIHNRSHAKWQLVCEYINSLYTVLTKLICWEERHYTSRTWAEINITSWQSRVWCSP